MRHTLRITCGIACVLLAAGIYMFRMRRDLAAPIAAPFTAVKEENLDHEAAFVAAAKSLRLRREEISSHSKALAEVPEKSAPTDCKWPAGSRKATFDIGAMLIFGEFGPYDFMRHVLLNPADRPLCPDEMKELTELLKGIQDATLPLISESRYVAQYDRIAQIEAGEVEPVKMPELSDEEKAQQIKSAVETYKRQGEVITDEEAERRLQSGAISLNKSPPSLEAILHKDKWYLNSSFKRLPKYDAMFEQVKYLALEEIEILVGWFVHHGLTSYTVELSQVVDHLRTMSPREIDQHK